jgi:hypothetical protein
MAQQVVATAGSTLSNTSGSISYTIGESVAQTLTKDDKTLTQGFHQTTISVSIVNELKDIDFSITVFPNPATDYLTQYIASLYDINGMLLLNKKFEGNETTISMGNLIPAIYFLKVTDNNKELKIFKIIKE